MNLRQKVKQAKKELKIVKETYPEKYTIDIAKKHHRINELQKIINLKRNFNREYVKWKEDYRIDSSNLTYVSFHGGYEELGVLSYPNGKTLSVKEVDAFIREMVQTKVIDVARKVAKQEPSDNEIINRVDYIVFLSNDRTKSKRLHKEKLFYQLKGNEKIYFYKSNFISYNK
ncbi:hypothetical protein [Priestia flexa]|uniref:hypothetical protein n=1 Tax=Priestia flexa TaxID=86664 RepID=UPI000473671B|nr:hypothetical protein [Priestia flexa]